MLKRIAARLRWLLGMTRPSDCLAALEEAPMSERIEDYRITAAWRGAPCEVYLFCRWTGYDHPVLPVAPLTHEEALLAPNFGRVYTSLGESPLMLAFDMRFVHRDPLGGEFASAGPGLYAAEPGPGEPVARGPQITAAEAVMRDAYIRVHEGSAELVRNNFDGVFEYDYHANGTLQRLTVRNDLGEVKILDY